jgi:hypothetical protein
MTDEEAQMERYRLSFTVGGLLVAQSVTVARVFLQLLDDACSAESATSTNDEAASESVDASSRTSTPPDRVGSRIGDRELNTFWKQARQQVIDEHLLTVRTQTAMSRTVSETIKRLSVLSLTELRFLTADDSMNADRSALMWVAMCRYYTLVGEFANEVLRDHYLLGKPTVTREDYDRFVYSKSLWHEELDQISDSTAKKLRSNLFQAMFEARLLEKEGNTIIPSLLGSGLTDILEKRPDSFLFFPMRVES